jgi:hypothetical protein
MDTMRAHNVKKCAKCPISVVFHALRDQNLQSIGHTQIQNVTITMQINHLAASSVLGWGKTPKTKTETGFRGPNKG